MELIKSKEALLYERDVVNQVMIERFLSDWKSKSRTNAKIGKTAKLFWYDRTKSKNKSHLF